MAFIENDEIEIEYHVQKERGYANVPPCETLDIKRVSVYVPAIDDWIEVTEVDSEQLDKRVMRMIEQHRAENEINH